MYRIYASLVSSQSLKCYLINSNCCGKHNCKVGHVMVLEDEEDEVREFGKGIDF